MLTQKNKNGGMPAPTYFFTSFTWDRGAERGKHIAIELWYLHPIEKLPSDDDQKRCVNVDTKKQKWLNAGPNIFLYKLHWVQCSGAEENTSPSSGDNNNIRRVWNPSGAPGRSCPRPRA